MMGGTVIYNPRACQVFFVICCTKVEMSASYQNRNVPFIVAAHFQRSEDRVKLSASPRTSVWLKA